MMMTNEQEIFALENKYWTAMKENDIDTAVSMTHFPCIVVSPKGVLRVDEPLYRKMMQSHDGNQFKSATMEDAKIDVLGENTAFISYSVNLNDIKMIDVSTWVREGSAWKCAFHSEVPREAPV